MGIVWLCNVIHNSGRHKNTPFGCAAQLGFAPLLSELLQAEEQYARARASLALQP
jgi:hypothetical protein